MKGDTWFKFYIKAPWSSSLRKLTPTQRWIFVTLLCLAAEGDGTIDKNAAEVSHIAVTSGADVRTVRKTLALMLQNCLINVTKLQTIEICNWKDYQADTKKRRARIVAHLPSNGADRLEEIRKEEKRKGFFSLFKRNPCRYAMKIEGKPVCEILNKPHGKNVCKNCERYEP